MIDFDVIDDIINDAFATLCDEFSQEQIGQLESVKWGWDGITHRKSGQVVGSPRDIVDTGELRDSLSLGMESPTECVYSYDAPHAAIVHEGAKLNNGKDIPARPWIESAISEYDLVENLARLIEDKL